MKQQDLIFSVGLFDYFFFPVPSQNGSVGIATSYKLHDGWVWVLVGSRIFPLLFRPVLGPTVYPFQWVLRALSPGVKQPGMKVITHLEPVWKPRKRVSALPFAFMAQRLISSAQGRTTLPLLPHQVVFHNYTRDSAYAKIHVYFKVEQSTALCDWNRNWNGMTVLFQ
jgi:hypothetical protein